MNRYCLFCEAPLVIRCREHAFPQWLLKELDISDAVVEPTHFEAGTSNVVSSRRHTLDGMKEGRVCATCNNGWMSPLETAAKTLLISLFKGERDVRDLDFRERPLLARWVAKTAYMLNSASNYCMKVQGHHLQYVRAHRRRLPEGVLAVAQQHRNTTQFQWAQLPMWGMTAAADENAKPSVDAMAREGYKICLQFAQLIVLVCYIPMPGWRYVMWRDVHHPLWPLIGPVGWAERDDDFPWNNSTEAVASFATTVEVMSPACAEMAADTVAASEAVAEATHLVSCQRGQT